MNKLATAFLLALLVPSLAAAAPVPGTYRSVDLGGALLTAHSSTSRVFPNSGLPQVFHVQSWDGTTLGTQYTIACGIQTVAFVPDSTFYNVGTGNGTIRYHQEFNGGTFSFNPGPWGDGSGTLTTTVVDIQVTFVAFTPVASRANIVTTGTFSNGCALRYAVGNGSGVCETPFCTLPATYPAFLDTNCLPTRQYGTWGNVNEIQMNIDCATPTHSSTWGQLKTLYR